MSSNIRINKVCEYCQDTFVAKTIKTRYCSPVCNKKDYKSKSREKKINSVTKPKVLKTINLTEINHKEFLTVKEVTTILNMSLRTVYRLIEEGKINSYNFSERKTMIRRKDIDSYFELNLNNMKINMEKLKKLITLENSYCMQEVCKKHNISESGLFSLIKRLEIPYKQHGKFVLVRKIDIDKIFTNND